jgi:hypothetical protein
MRVGAKPFPGSASQAIFGPGGGPILQRNRKFPPQPILDLPATLVTSLKRRAPNTDPANRHDGTGARLICARRYRRPLYYYLEEEKT